MSLNAIIGDNGIISNAMDAKLKSGMAELEEFLQEKYVENFDKFKEDEPKVIGLKNIYPNYFYIPSKEVGIGLDYISYVEEGEAKELYLIKKSGLPKEIRDGLVGGDAGEGKYNDYSSLNDVYGVTSDLRVYYCSSGMKTIVGLTKDDLDKENVDRVVFNQDSEMSKLLSKFDTDKEDGGLTYRELMSTGNLELTSSDIGENFSFKDFYNFSSLKSLTLKNVTITNPEGLNGIENCINLNEIRIENSVISNYDGIGKLEDKLKLLYFWGVDDTELNKIVNGMNAGKLTKLEKVGFVGYKLLSRSGTLLDATLDDVTSNQFWETTNNRSAIWDDSYYENYSKILLSLDLLSKLDSDTKKNIKYLSVAGNDLTSLTGLDGFSGLYLLRAEKNNISDLEAIKDLTSLQYLMLDYNKLESLPSFKSGSQLLYLSVNNNSGLEGLDVALEINDKGLKSLAGLENCSNLTYINCINCNLGYNNDLETNKGDDDSLKALNNKEKLKEVRLTNNPDIRWIDYLGNSKKTLKLLWLDGCKNINLKSVTQIKSLLIGLGNNLKIDSMYNYALLDKDTTTFQDLKNQKLGETELDSLKLCTKIDTLSLQGCNITPRSGKTFDKEINDLLESLTNMKYLNLNGLKNLTDISFVSSMPNLIELDIRGTSVVDLTPLETRALGGNLSLKTLATDVEGTDLNTIPTVINNCTGGGSDKSGNYWTFENNTVQGGIIASSTILNTINREDSEVTYLRINHVAYGNLDFSKSNLEEFAVRHISGSVKFPESLKSFYMWGYGGPIEFNPNTKLTFCYWHNGDDAKTIFSRIANLKVETVQVGYGGVGCLYALSLLEGTGVKNFSMRSVYGSYKNPYPNDELKIPSSLEVIQFLWTSSTGVVGEFPSSIVGANGTNLNTLELRGIQFSNANFVKDLTKLKTLKLVNCNISTIDFPENNVLDDVDLTGNTITDLKNFQKLKNCTALNLTTNSILGTSGCIDENGLDSECPSMRILANLNPNNPDIPEEKKGKLVKLYIKGCKNKLTINFDELTKSYSTKQNIQWTILQKD